MKDKLQSVFNGDLAKWVYARNEVKSNIQTFTIKPEGILSVVQFLKNSTELQFDYLNDLTAVDWLGVKTPRFEVVIILKSFSKSSTKVMLKVPLEEGEAMPSLTQIFKGANWPEREVFDLFGIRFLNHPKMDRIVMPDNFVGHPLRKDYPIEGFGQDYLMDELLRAHKDDRVTPT